MMQLPAVLAILGTALSIGSVVAGSLILQALSRKATALNERIVQKMRQIELMRHYFEAGEPSFTAGQQILISIQQQGTPETIFKGYFPVAIRHIIQAVAHRMTAVNVGEAPRQDPDADQQRLIELRARALGGDVKSMNDIDTFYEELTNRYFDVVKSVQAEEAELKQAAGKVSERSKITSFVAIGLQIVGLIIVLLKDLVKS
jgi:hypothetical protein